MNVNFVLFDDFETMDAFGPAQVFGMAPEYYHLNYLSVNGGIVNSSQGVKVWTEILEPSKVKDLLVIPGGRGARKLLCLEPDVLEIVKASVREASYCLMVASGSALLAQTGILFHREVADYPYDENWKRMFSAGIRRVPGIRWTADGKFYSCSATAYGIDMALGAVEDTVDIDVAIKIAEQLGYAWDEESREGSL